MTPMQVQELSIQELDRQKTPAMIVQLTVGQYSTIDGGISHVLYALDNKGNIYRRRRDGWEQHDDPINFGFAPMARPKPKPREHRNWAAGQDKEPW